MKRIYIVDMCSRLKRWESMSFKENKKRELLASDSNMHEIKYIHEFKEKRTQTQYKQSQTELSKKYQQNYKIKFFPWNWTVQC